MTKPWIIYTRVSTEDQAREGVSLAAQLQACRSMLQISGDPPHEHIEDAGASAKDLNRPGIQQVLELVDGGRVAGVVIYKLDRITRSLRDLIDLLERFEASGVALLSVQEKLDTSSAMGRFVVHMIAAIAQWEREQIAERIKTAMDYRRSRGGFVGGRIPAGLRAEGDGDERRLVADPEHAPAVTACWQLIIDGKTLRQVAEHLDAAGVPTVAKAWTPNGARHLLRNDRYVGLLVDRATFDAAGAELDARWSPRSQSGRRIPAATGSDRVWILAGIARCAQCGSPLIGVSTTNRHGTTYPYLRCNGRARFGKRYCTAKDLPAVPWEGAILQALSAGLQDDDQVLPRLARLAEIGSQKRSGLDERRRKLQLEHDQVERRISNLADLAADGGAVARSLAPRLQEEQSRLEQLELELAAIDGQLAAHQLSDATIAATLETLRDGAARLLELEPEDQAHALRTLVHSATLHAGDDQREGEVELELNLPPSDLVGNGKFVSHSPLVEQRSLRTNPGTPGELLRLTVAVQLSRGRRCEQAWK